MKRIAFRHPTFVTALLCTALSAPGCIGSRRPQPKANDAEAGEAAAARPSGGKVVLDPNAVDDKLSDLVGKDRVQATYTNKDPYKGAELPLVTIVEYSDFQCPFCSKLANTLDEVVDAYPNDVRLVFKQFPLPMHKDAEPGARAALAAHEQGKFWEMHNKLFANQRAMGTGDLKRYSKEIGLDPAKFDARLEADELQARVNDDVAGGKVLEVTGTPAFFVNGKKFSGALPVDRIKSIVEEERKAAIALIEAGSKREELYARVLKAAAPGKGEKPKPKDPEFRRGGLSKVPNYAVPLSAASPTRGPKDALVTVIEYNALSCEDCRKAGNVVDQVAKKHPEVRFAFAHLPGDDVLAQRAAKAGVAAHQQGKFWEMRKAMLAAPFDARALLELITKLELDTDKFKVALAAKETAATVDYDVKVVDVFRGVTKAPIVFVNGRALSGVPTVAELEALISEESGKAEKLMGEKKLAKDATLYAKMVEGWRGWTSVAKVVKDGPAK